MSVYGDAQRAANERSDLRSTVKSLAAVIETQIDLENSMVPDEPEGTVVIQIDLSKTMAEKLVGQLRRVEAMI